jgi:hypothetical protein
MAPSSRKLPAADRAVVELTKVAEYLLNASHPDNGGKARFLTGTWNHQKVGDPSSGQSGSSTRGRSFHAS